MNGGNMAGRAEHMIVRNLLKSCELLMMLWSVTTRPQDLGVPPLTSPEAGRSLSPYKTTRDCEGGQ